MALVPRDRVGALAGDVDVIAVLEHLEVTRSRQSSASPKQSKPGPRLALVAGTSTVTARPPSAGHRARTG